MSIVITGNPGVGKHTIAMRVSHITNFPVVDINTIAKDLGMIEETSDVDGDKLKKTISDYLQNTKLAVGHLAPYCIPSKDVKKVIVLRRNPYELLKVYQKRGYSKKKIKDNIGSEVLGIIANDSLNEFGEKVSQVDVSKKDVETCSKIILDIINGKDYNDSVDWLQEVADKDDLREFFSY